MCFLYIKYHEYCPMRLQCEFKSCACLKFNGRGQRCQSCGHGHCWHLRPKQFESTRAFAIKPRYINIPVVLGIIEPRVPDLPNYTPDFNLLPV